MAKEVMGIDRTGSPSDGPTLVTTMIDRPGCLILPPGRGTPGARTAHQRTGDRLVAAQAFAGPIHNSTPAVGQGAPCPTGVSASPVATPPPAGLAAAAPRICRRLRPDEPGSGHRRGPGRGQPRQPRQCCLSVLLSGLAASSFVSSSAMRARAVSS
jgi:hypothetical protein